MRTSMPRRRRAATLPVVAALALTAVMADVPASAAGTSTGPKGPAADIRYTEHGVPHIRANDFTGLGYGYGYAVATDNICVLADTYLTVGARRSRHLGPDAPGNSAFGSASTSLSSDLYFQQVNDSGVVERAVAAPPPHGPRAEARELVRGYVAGYNRYLRETGVDGISDPACRGASWVRPITELDVYRHLHALSTVAGGGVLADSITAAAPPTADTAPAPVPADAARRVLTALGRAELGSNAIAIGSAGTESRRGLLLGNPHFPWHGGRRFWQSQLTVPGRMNVSGASLLGLPLVQIGFNRNVSWSHTVSTAATFGLFEVRLVPGDPTSYLVDGRPERMTSRRVAVPVRAGDGSVSTVERTLYSTRYGPVLSLALGLPLSWTETSAFSVRDPNRGNLRGLNTWFELARARSTRDVVRALSRTQGAPWVNTIAADRFGNAFYGDIQVVPHVTDEHAARCGTPLGAVLFPGTGISVLDGTRSDCAWGRDRDALVPGIFGPSRMPVLTRRDYVTNSNDSPWLANPRRPVTGYPRGIGDIGTERSPRTRMGIVEVERRLAGDRFSREDMQRLLFGNRTWTGEEAAADTAAMCAALPGGRAPTSGGGSVDAGAACAALSEWDTRLDTTSRGALLFERFWPKVAGIADVWRVPFDPADPVGTPNTLDTTNPLVAQALGDAIVELRAAGIEPGAPLGDHQFVVRGGDRIPIHGGPGALGVLNVISPVWDPARGPVEVRSGSSHVQVVAHTGGPCPDAVTLLTYSQSADPTSPHFADQTELFSRERWVRSRFCERDIRAYDGLRVVRLR